MNNFPLSTLPFLGPFLNVADGLDVFKHGVGVPPVSKRATRAKGHKFASQKSRANRRKSSAKARRS